MIPRVKIPAMAAANPDWDKAEPADAHAALASMRAFYVEEHLPFNEAAQGDALHALLVEPALGAVFLLRPTQTSPSPGAPLAVSPPLGHLVLTWAFSLEFGGRFVLLDELYLDPSARGRGEGRRAMEFAIAWARVKGAKALRLEVARENPRARALYEKTGLESQARDLMTLRLA